MGEKNITKNQHYVPQVYLRGFSSDHKRVWSYALDPMDNGKLVPIESVCREKYLYEVRDDNGNLLGPNWLENVLCSLEGLFAKYLRALEEKAFHPENYWTKCFFTTEEKTFWKAYIAIQMMRRPDVIQATHDVVCEFLGDQFSENRIHAAALAQCLPFFNEIKPEDISALSIVLRPLLNMSIVMGVDESGTLFTSDSPVYCYTPHRSNLAELEEYDTVILPLTSKLVIVLHGKEFAKQHGNNRLLPFIEDDLESIKLPIAYSAHTRIFSQKELPENDRKLIEQARRDKNTDETAQRG